MITVTELARLDLFADLTDDELAWIIANGKELFLEPGDYFVREGDKAERFYVVLEGELQITRSLGGKEMVMGTTPRGIMGAEVSMLNAVPSNVTARAILPSRLLVLELAAFRQLFAAVPPLGTKVLRIAAERMAGFATLVKQQEKMAALGKLSAGLAHELNNPAAAARRASAALADMLPAITGRALELCKLGLGPGDLDRLVAYQARVAARRTQIKPLSTIERADREDELGDWLDARSIPQAWELAAGLVSAGVDLAELEDLAAGIPSAALGETIAWISAAIEAEHMLNEIEVSTRNIAELIGAVKSYSYMDQAPVQEVDLNRDLENTLIVLGHKLRKGVQVVREYDPNLPKIQGRGGELNQVWTNLIANAIEAMNYTGILRVITRCEHDFAMVEVADNGTGIPPEIMPRIFEPFFTTKDVGEGTGLGLDISYRIVQQHHGTIEVQSQPGNTRFIVRLPVGSIEG